MKPKSLRDQFREFLTRPSKSKRTLRTFEQYLEHAREASKRSLLFPCPRCSGSGIVLLMPACMGKTYAFPNPKPEDFHFQIKFATCPVCHGQKESESALRANWDKLRETQVQNTQYFCERMRRRKELIDKCVAIGLTPDDLQYIWQHSEDYDADDRY